MSPATGPSLIERKLYAAFVPPLHVRPRPYISPLASLLNPTDLPLRKLRSLTLNHLRKRHRRRHPHYLHHTRLLLPSAQRLARVNIEYLLTLGKDFNVTRAGIHADGLLKNQEIYNCFDTEKLLNRPVGVAITDKAGLAGIKAWIEARYEINIPKRDPHILKIKDKIDAEYSANRTSAISDSEMLKWVKQSFGKNLPPEK